MMLDRGRAGVGVDSAEVFIEREAQIFGRGPGGRHGDTEDGVGAELGLVFCAVEFDERAVDVDLFEGIEAADFAGDRGVDVFDGGENAFALVAFLVAIAEFDGFIFAGGGAGGDRGAAKGSVFEDDVDFDGRVTAGVKYFTSSTYSMMLMDISL